jgi:glycosyltransferase involved in cell wall biosynthesis
MFDIIIVCFNDDNRLIGTLNSIKKLAFKNSIIIQDGSRLESTNNIIENFKKELHIIHVAEKDKGLYDAMNKAVAYVESQFFLTVNCGDLLLTSSIPFYVSNFDLIFCSVLKTDKNKNDSIYFPELQCLSSRMSACHQGIFISKRFFDNVNGYNVDYKIAADYHFLSKSIIDCSSYCVLRDLIVVQFEGFGGLSESSRFLLEFETAKIKSNFHNKYKISIVFVYLLHLFRFLKFKLS